MNRLRGMSLAGVVETDAGAVMIFGGVNAEEAEATWIDATIEMLPADVIKGLRDRFEAISSGRTWEALTLPPLPIQPDFLFGQKARGEGAVGPACGGDSGELPENTPGANAPLADEAPVELPAVKTAAVVPYRSAAGKAAVVRREAKFAQKLERRSRLQAVRKALGLSCTQVARRSGVTVFAVDNAFSRGVGRDAIPRIVAALAVNPAWLESGEGEMFLSGKQQIGDKTMGAKISETELSDAFSMRARIKEACKVQGLTGEKLAAAVGVARTFFCPSTKWRITDAQLDAIAGRLNVARSWIVTGEGSMLDLGRPVMPEEVRHPEHHGMHTSPSGLRTCLIEGREFPETIGGCICVVERLAAAMVVFVKAREEYFAAFRAVEEANKFL